MKLNFDFQIKALDGKEFKGDESNAAKILGSMLSALNKGNSMKLWDWAQTIWNKKDLEIDKTDSEVLKALIENSESLPVITKAQLIERIKE